MHADDDVDIEDFDADGWTPLHRSAHAGDVALVRSLLARGAYVNVSSRLKERQKPIHRAAAAGHAEALAALLEAGANAKAPTPALELAASGGHVESVRLLLGRVQHEAAELHAALAASLRAAAGAACVPVLLEAGAPVCLAPGEYGSPLHGAARAGDPAAFRAIFEAAKGFLEEHPPTSDNANALLESAVIGGSGEIIRMLSASGVSVLQVVQDSIPAYLAAVHGHADAIRALAALGAPLEGENASKSPVCAAAKAGKLDALSALLECGAPVDGPPRVSPPLCLAAKEGHADAVRLLLERGAKWGAGDPREGGAGPLALACRGATAAHGHTVAALLEAGCDPDFTVAGNPRGGVLGDPRPLSHPAVVQTLEARGRQVNLEPRVLLTQWDNVARCPLTLAAERGDAAAVQFMLERGVKGDGADLFVDQRRPGKPVPGPSAVAYAAERGHAAVLRLLAGAGGDLEARCRVSELRPLELAARGGHAEAAAVLMELAYHKPGASAGEAALQAAVYGGLLDVARALLERGASPAVSGSSRDPKLSSTAAEIAAEKGYAELLGVMLEAEPKLQARKWLDKLAAIAARGPSVDSLRLLLERGADVNARAPLASNRELLATPLLIACESGSYPCAKELLARGASAQDALTVAVAGPMADAFVVELPTALELATSAANATAAAGIVRLLAQHGARVRKGGGIGLGSAPILERPVQGRSVGVVRALLAAGADPSAGAPLRLAAKVLDVPIVRLLLAAGAPPNQTTRSTDRDGDSALGGALYPHFDRMTSTVSHSPAVLHDRAEVIRELLRGGADPYAGGLQAAILTLGVTGRDLDLFEAEGRPVPLASPAVAHVLIQAVESRGDLHEHQLSVVRALLARGLDTSAVGLRGASPLHAALVSKFRRLILTEYVAAASDVNVRDAEGRAPLHLVQEAADAAPLMDRGADVGARDAAGRTPAVMAAAAGRLDVLRLLVERGAMASAREGEVVAAACRAPADTRRPLLGYLLELETGKAGMEGRTWPAVSRRGDGTLDPEGPAGGYSAAALIAADYNAAFTVEDMRGWLDLLMMCPGTLKPSEIGAGEGAGARPEHASVAAAAASVLRAEGRLEGSPAQGDPFAEACRGGFRLCALRLAAAIPIDFVDLPDARGETPLWHAVAGEPPMLDVCLALLQRGADLGAQIGAPGEHRLVLDATRDADFRARLKQGAARREVFISYGHHPPEVARFTAQLRDRIQLGGLSCWMDEMKATGIEAGTEWREQIGTGLTAARAVVFVASKHSCASDWCRKELTRARDLGIPVLPVWREAVSPLQPETASLLRSAPSFDFTADPLLEAGFDEFLERLRQAVQQSSAAAEGDGSGDARAALLAAAAASSASEPASPLYFVWCLPEDAARGADVVRCLASQGRRCFAECPADGATGTDELDRAAAEALRVCAAFVPLVSPAAAAAPAAALLLRRLRVARELARPVRPVPLTPLRVPASLQYSLARTRAFFLPRPDPAAFFPCLDALLATVRDAAQGEVTRGPEGSPDGSGDAAPRGELEQLEGPRQPGGAAPGPAPVPRDRDRSSPRVRTRACALM